MANSWAARIDSRLKQFCQKHSRGLTLLGAFVVFATYVSKEALRDRARDLLAEIRTAQASYVQREQYESLAATMFLLEEEKHYLPPPKVMSRGKNDRLTFGQLRESLRPEMGVQGDFQPLLDNATFLTAALPFSPELNESHRKVVDLHLELAGAMGEVKGALAWEYPNIGSDLLNRPATVSLRSFGRSNRGRYKVSIVEFRLGSEAE
jgi:hypothetical protein